MDIYAWVGEDELGSGEVGIKQGFVPAGLIPLVSVGKEKLSSENIRQQLQIQANMFGKTIRLMKFSTVAEEIVIEPQTKPERAAPNCPGCGHNFYRDMPVRDGLCSYCVGVQEST